MFIEIEIYTTKSLAFLSVNLDHNLKEEKINLK